MGSVTQDLRYALRMLRTAPAFSTAAIATLALAIGANTAIFTVCDAVLLKPLPYADPDRLVAVFERQPAGLRNSVTPATFVDWRQRARSFADMAASRSGALTIVEGDRASSVVARSVTPNYFDVLGVAAALGRTFREGDEQPGRTVAVLTNYAWRSVFGSDAAVVGRTVHLDGQPRTVVGVLEENAAIDRAQIEVFLPGAVAPGVPRRDTHFLTVTARLRPDASIEAAQAEMDVIAAAIAVEHPETNRGWGVVVDPLNASLVSPSLRQSLLVLLAAVGLILLIGCANVANLTLARSSARRRELAVRAAIGATRARIVRQLLVESVVLSLCGAAVAVVLGGWMLRLMTALMPAALLPSYAHLAIDLRVVAFTAAAGVGTALVAGLVPAALVARANLHDALKQEARAGGARTRRTFRSLLVVGETAMATALLAAAALLVVSLVRLLQVDPGFDPAHVLAMRVSLPSGRYPTPADTRAFHRDVIERLDALPGVEHAAASISLPLRGWLLGEPFEIEGRGIEKARRPFAHFQSVTPDYFRTLGLRVVAGRSFTAADDERERPVAMVNRTLVERFFEGASPIGSHLVFDTGIGAVAAPGTRWEIVGVVGRVKVASLADAESASPEIYVPMAQVPSPAVWITVRAADPASLARAATDAIRQIDRALPVTRVGTMVEAVDGSTLPARFRMRLLGALALLALVLAAVGIYGVRSYTIGERVPEIGVRMALGAAPADIRRLMLREGVWMIGGGVAIGLGIAALLTRTLATLLFGVGATDPLTFAVAAAVMALVGLAATALPARRAARLDPVQALNRL